MSRGRFHIWMIMIVIAAVAFLMALLRLMLPADPMWLVVVIPLLIIYFTPFIGLAIAFRVASLRLLRASATHRARHHDRTREGSESGEAEKV